MRAKYTGAYSNYGFLAFKHTIDDPCQSALITVDTSWISTNPLNYIIGNTQQIETISDSHVSHNGHADCPELVKEFTNLDGSAIDSSIFTVTYFSSYMELGIYSDDFSKIDTYNLKLSVRFDGESYGNNGWYTPVT